MINSSIRFDRDAFTAMYLENEGSSVGANWILSTLDADGDGTITVAEIQTRLSVVLDRCKDNLMKDISSTVCILSLVKLTFRRTIQFDASSVAVVLFGARK